jgi:predicted metal-dependent phosphoesterase TrpH
VSRGQRWRRRADSDTLIIRRMKADLHVHSCHSLESGSFKFLRSRDCYSSPEDVYRTAKARGMDLVTITDHDSIGGCLEFLDRHPDADDFIIGEEVSCRFPDGDIEVHLGVYGLNEAIHRELQPLRSNVFDVAALLHDRGVFFALNHLLFFYRGQTPLESYLRILDIVPAVEARNGAMLPMHNDLVEETARQSGRLAMTAGSDAHTLRRIGRTFIEVPGSRDAGSFLAGLRRGEGCPGGRHGNVGALTADIYGVVTRYVASLAGYGPADHTVTERLVFGAFSLVSAPFQFLPFAAACQFQLRQRRHVAAARAALSLRPDAVAEIAAQGAE